MTCAQRQASLTDISGSQSKSQLRRHDDEQVEKRVRWWEGCVVIEYIQGQRGILALGCNQPPSECSQEVRTAMMYWRRVGEHDTVADVPPADLSTNER